MVFYSSPRCVTFTFKPTDVRANNVKLLRYVAETLDKFWTDQEVL